jgi:5-formyltetrahydrofolate cyclo-ligase
LASKSDLRKNAHAILKSISKDRKIKASEDFFAMFESLAFKEAIILSFSPLSYELDVSKLNRLLTKKKKLALPRVVNNELEIYLVDDLSNLTLSNYGILEPSVNPEKKISIEKISHILVPALLFDPYNNRLGHGFGFYDRLLKDQKAKTIGIGFIEQLHTPFLPISPHDVALNELFLF